MMHESMYSGITEQLLFATLECYFKNNCDKLKTAEELLYMKTH